MVGRWRKKRSEEDPERHYWRSRLLMDATMRAMSTAAGFVFLWWRDR